MTRVFWSCDACLCEGRIDFENVDTIRHVAQAIAIAHVEANDPGRCRKPARDLEVHLGSVLKPRRQPRRRR